MQHAPKSRRLRTLSLALTIVCLTTLAGLAAAADLPAKFDPLNAAHRAMLQPLFGTEFNPGPDPNGDIVFYIGKELATVPTDTYELRHVIIDHDNINDFALEFEVRGGADGSGNPSHFIIFGWQDHKNYYYSYPAESPESRIARVVDGKHQTLYRHGSNTWVRDRVNYQTIRVELNTVNGKRVVDTIVNGEVVMSYTFADGQEPPAGKTGISMWNNALHNAYFKNISLTVK